MEKSVLNVGGMHCNSCVEIIKMAVEDIPNAKIVSTESTGKVEVEYDSKTTLEKIKNAIKKEGYAVQ